RQLAARALRQQSHGRALFDGWLHEPAAADRRRHDRPAARVGHVHPVRVRMIGRPRDPKSGRPPRAAVPASRRTARERAMSGGSLVAGGLLLLALAACTPAPEAAPEPPAAAQGSAAAGIVIR